MIAALIVVIVLLAIAPWEIGTVALPPSDGGAEAQASARDAGAPATGADGEAGSPVSPALPHDPLAVNVRHRLAPPLIGLVAGDAGGGHHLHLSLDSGEALMLLVTGLLFFVARLLAEAERLADEHSQIV